MMNSHFVVILSDSNTTFIVTRDTKVLLFTFTASMGARTLAERSGILFCKVTKLFLSIFLYQLCRHVETFLSAYKIVHSILYIVHAARLLFQCENPLFFLPNVNCDFYI